VVGLTGATGYIGGRLLHALESRGERVRCLSRRPEYLEARVDPGIEVVRGDVSRPRTLRPALEGVETAYYLVHSIGSGGSFVEADRKAAAAFARAARAVGVRRLVYLGGLGEGDLSEHLASRQEVGRILRESGVPVIEFRASIVLGSGSASFEMLRALVERLPVMVTPPRQSGLTARPRARHVRGTRRVIAFDARRLVGANNLLPGEPKPSFAIAGDNVMVLTIEDLCDGLAGFALFSFRPFSVGRVASRSPRGRPSGLDRRRAPAAKRARPSSSSLT
jgi:nucleoside-diphosphate-sugar epimerase